MRESNKAELSCIFITELHKVTCKGAWLNCVQSYFAEFLTYNRVSLLNPTTLSLAPTFAIDLDC